VRTTGSAGTTIEHGVAREQHPALEVWCVEDHTARGVARCVKSSQRYISDSKCIAVVDVAAWCFIWMGSIPQHLIVRVDQDRCIDEFTEFDDLGDMVIMTVGQQDS